MGGTDYSVLQFENLKKKNCNDLFEREKLGEGAKELVRGVGEGEDPEKEWVELSGWN